jgi:hypothetical protein
MFVPFLTKSGMVNKFSAYLTKMFRLSEVLLSLKIIIIIFSGSAAQRGLWLPRLRCFLITHNDAPQSVGLLWTSDQLVAETSI